MSVRHKWLAGLVALGLILGSHSIGGKAQVSPPMPVSSDPRPQVTLADDGLILDWRAPEAQVVPRADGTVGVAMSGYGLTDEPGLPQLPFASALIALPPDASPTLQVLESDEYDLSIDGPLPLAPKPDGVVRDADGHPFGVTFAPVQNGPTVNRQPGAALLEPVGVMRGVRLARVVFYPVRTADEPSGVHLRVTTHLRVSVAFGAPILRNALPSSVPFDPLLAAVQSAVVNPDQVRSAQSVASNAHTLLGIPDPKIAIEVSAPGLTAITYEALSGNGFPASSVDPHNIHLARNGIEIALDWVGNDDALFEPGELFLFYADPRTSRWTRTDVYFLWQDATPGLRMSSRSAAPASQPSGVAWMDATAEVNALYTPDCFCRLLPPGRDGDRWTWDDLKNPGNTSGAYPINLPSAVNTTQPATLTVWLIGYTDVPANPDHRVDVRLNNASLGRVEWNGKQAVTATLTVAPGVLQSNLNTVTLTLPGLPGVSTEGMWLDAFSIHDARGSAASGGSAIFTGQPTPHAYTLALTSTTALRSFDVTDPDHPLWLTDVTTNGNNITLGDPSEGGLRRYDVVAQEGLVYPAYRHISPLQTITGTDYLIITPNEFAPALSSLIALRQSQGLSVTVENPQPIYDAFGDGRPDPQAIRAFIANAYATWNPRPTYVLLVGDGSFDPKRYRADSTPTFIPPYLAYVDPLTAETAADNRYVTVDGADDLPDLLIGRLPVKTLVETQAVVNKIVQYETNPYPGNWSRNVTLVADDADSGWSYANESDLVASTYLTLPLVVTRRYCDGVSLYVSDCSAQDATAIHTQLLNDWNRGAFIMQFTGHSSWQQWAEERFFHLDDLPSLYNSRRWPIVLEMTCFTGAFQRPEPTLDEELLVRSDAGAVATWGSTTLGVTTGHMALAHGFYGAVFRAAVSTMGEATLAGKLELASTGQNLDLLNTFVLLGDPATRFDRTVVPWATQVYLPAVLRSSP